MWPRAHGMEAVVGGYRAYVDRDPYGFYSDSLREGPVHWDEGMGAWLVLGYAEARSVLVQEDVFGHPYNSFRGAAETQGGPRGILLLQGEEHARMHNFLLSQFSPGVVRRYRENLVRPLVERRLGAILGRDSVDLASELAGAVPSDVIAALLGLDWHDDGLLAACRGWNSTIFRWSETFGEDDAATAEALAAAGRLDEVLLPVIRARRVRPADDLISLLWDKGPAVLQPWGEAEILAQCRVLFFAGSDTTAHLLRNLLYVLLTDPGVDERLRTEPNLVGSFVDEVLRLYGPIHFRVRVALADVELGGASIRRGDRVHPVNAGANRDPRHYPDPDRLDIDRAPLRDHLAFNAGPRFCVGAALARAEGAEVVEQILERSSGVSWADGAQPARFLGYMPRSYRPLIASFKAAVR